MVIKVRDLSITIVSYHNEEDIKKAVASIEQYTPESISKQIYIVDNASGDGNDETAIGGEKISKSDDTKGALDVGKEKRCALAELAEVYQDVTYVPAGKNLGFGRGHNYVLGQLDSKYHAIVNPDIILTEDAFSKLIRFMEDESIGMCVPRLVDEEGNLLAVYRRDLTVWDMFIRMFLKGAFKKRQAYHTMQDADYTKSFDVPFAQGSFLLIRTKLFQELGGFDDRFFMYMEDADLCKRVNQVSRLCYCPEATVIHKWEKGSHKSGKLFKFHVQSMISYFMKWGWR